MDSANYQEPGLTPPFKIFGWSADDEVATPRVAWTTCKFGAAQVSLSTVQIPQDGPQTLRASPLSPMFRRRLKA